jgi:hypothetical protein
MTMGWIDCVSGGSALGRGHPDRGRWATKAGDEGEATEAAARAHAAFDVPSWAPNPFTNAARAFNIAYYYRHVPRQKRGVVAPEGFFYPLDAIWHWNRVYGSRGFHAVPVRAAARRGRLPRCASSW